MRRAPLQFAASIAFATAAFGTGSADAQVTLRLVDPANLASSSISVAPGAAFSLDAYVQGLTSPALNVYDLTLASLPTGFALTSFTDTAPTGWEGFPDVPNRHYGAANFEGSDITGSAVLVRMNFSAATTPGAYGIDFAAQAPLVQQLLDAASQPIPFSQFSATVNVVPEPATIVLVALGLALANARRAIRSRRCLKHSQRFGKIACARHPDDAKGRG